MLSLRNPTDSLNSKGFPGHLWHVLALKTTHTLVEWVDFGRTVKWPFRVFLNAIENRTKNSWIYINKVALLIPQLKQYTRQASWKSKIIEASHAPNGLLAFDCARKILLFGQNWNHFHCAHLLIVHLLGKWLFDVAVPNDVYHVNGSPGFQTVAGLYPNNKWRNNWSSIAFWRYLGRSPRLCALRDRDHYRQRAFCLQPHYPRVHHAVRMHVGWLWPITVIRITHGLLWLYLVSGWTQTIFFGSIDL